MIIQTVAEVARLWTTRRKIQTLVSSATTYGLVAWLFCGLLAGCTRTPTEVTTSLPEAGEDGSFHVYPGDNIQRFLDAAAASSTKTVTVHAGTYRPAAPAQALIHFTRQHDGITLQGEGEVILSAANADVAAPGDRSYPAIVNHVVYFGDGIGDATTLRRVTLTGANGFAGTDASLPALEPPSERPEIQTRGMFYYLDGGAIKIFGCSAPTIEDVLIHKNSTRLCGAGVSVEQRGLTEQSAVFRNCLFIDNHCPGTGAAIDLLSGSSATIENCLFVGNIANTGMDQIAKEFGLTYKPQHGCGALTVFPQSRAEVSRCTFTQNWNGVDDAGQDSRYLDCIFWRNDASDVSRPAGPYELDVAAAEVSGCWIGGAINDLRGTIDADANQLDAPDPQFDDTFVPQAEPLSNPQPTGYRPVRTPPPHIPALQGRSH
ncbi:right-handed parallel beta-helix repeat-containing protein [Roseimaritima ulvae]|uniref:Right handed beta helix domain-containing protein n=1 Tax=Roseimaritima ulvae TaxID=980254 RepID=A0A5B9QX38_9BACT|nr:right-handed parallel beta-helix repeat-containing protein [Roseimaritima ulvae]QEG43588.1 hypothetical protein UC8_56390 [Roseimaritima ulvae]